MSGLRRALARAHVPTPPTATAVIGSSAWTGSTSSRFTEQAGRVQVVVESAPAPMGCRACGVLVGSHGRRDVALIDVPCFGRPVQLVWRKRTWRCTETACTGKAFTEQHAALARPRALLTSRAAWWAVGQLRREHASVAGMARQLGTTWRTVWRAIQPLLDAMAADEASFADVTSLGVDEHVWHHVSTKPRPRAGAARKS